MKILYIQYQENLKSKLNILPFMRILKN